MPRPKGDPTVIYVGCWSRGIFFFHPQRLTEKGHLGRIDFRKLCDFQRILTDLWMMLGGWAPRTWIRNVVNWPMVIVSKSPKDRVVGPLPSMASLWLINGGYQLLTKWDYPPSGG